MIPKLEHDGRRPESLSEAWKWRESRPISPRSSTVPMLYRGSVCFFCADFFFLFLGRLLFFLLIDFWLSRSRRWLVRHFGRRRRIAFRVDKLEEEFRLEETQVRIAFHHVLDPPLGAVECVRIRVIWLDIGQGDESRLGIQIDLWEAIEMNELIKRRSLNSLKLLAKTFKKRKVGQDN